MPAIPEIIFTANWALLKFFAFSNGTAIAALAKSIPAIDPAPKKTVYTIPKKTDLMPARTKSISAALPAKPWAAPTKNGLWKCVCVSEFLCE